MAIKKETSLKVWKDRVWNAVFPRFCVSCNEEGSLLCKTCLATWEPPLVEETTDVLSLFSYADPIARDLVRAWKYHFDLSAFDRLKQKIRPRLHTVLQVCQAREIEAIVPVPLHESRLCERGFDQAVLLAQFLSEEVGIPVVEALHRYRATGKQSERTPEDRKQEMAESPFFVVRRSPPSVLLVDDVWTTGATSRAAASTLHRAGAKQLTVFTIAKS